MKTRKTKLSPEQQRQVRVKYADGFKYSFQMLAREFGVSKSTIHAIVNNHVRAREEEIK